MAIIEVNHITKEFQLGQLQNLKSSVQRLVARMNGYPPPARPNFKALDDVHFEVEQGEVLGIIGHNGAGKSTLLKMLSRITVPSTGRVTVHGKVAPLIEVGAGLVGDLTGRENIYLNAAILGMSKKAIQSKFDEIVDFSELEEFLDTPVKRYSSGMSVRLGFSIATVVEADILIVDEVLAVGDLAFQRKCFDRMEQIIKHSGKTVLLVSHNIRQVERMCKRAILLDHGQVVTDGPVKAVCNQFYDLMDKKVHAQARQASVPETINRIRSTGQFFLESLSLSDETGAPIEEVIQGATVIVEMTGETKKPLRNPVFAVGIHTTDFLYLATARSAVDIVVQEMQPSRFRVRCKIMNFPLLPGIYALRASVSEGDISRTIFYAENISPFRVLNVSSQRSEVASEGLVTMQSSWFPPELISSTPP